MYRTATKTSFAYRAGQLVGTALRKCSAFTRRLELSILGAGMSSGVSAWIFRTLGACIICFFLYVSFWIAAVLFLLWVVRGMSELGFFPQTSADDDVGFDSDGLFPDPYSQDNIHDPLFDHDDL